jgi:hypothetical protein
MRSRNHRFPETDRRLVGSPSRRRLPTKLLCGEREADSCHGGARLRDPLVGIVREAALEIGLANRSIRTLATFVGGPGSLGPQPWPPNGRRMVYLSYQPMEQPKPYARMPSTTVPATSVSRKSRPL